MTAKPSASKSWVDTIISAALRMGVAREDLLAHAALNEDILRQGRLAMDDVTRLWRAAGELTGDPGFGLKVGTSVGPASFDVVGFLVLSAASLRDAVGKLQAFQRLISDGGRFQILAGEKASWLIYHPQQGELAFSHHQIEAVLASVVHFSSWVMGSALTPRGVQFSHEARSPAAAYRAVFGEQVLFGGAYNGLLLDDALLDAPLPTADAALAALHDRYAHAQLAELSGELDLPDRVRQWLQTALPAGRAERRLAARQFGMSERSLAHRLQCSDTSFVALVEQTRRELALELLGEGALDLAAIAARLGFSEPSAFCRAFRRWQGVSPRRWQRGARSRVREEDGVRGGPR